mgnify:CR=1 FL=1
MSYTTVNDLDEKLVQDITGNEVLLISDTEESFKFPMSSISGYLDAQFVGVIENIKSKVIDDISNFVHSNATQFFAVAKTDMVAGNPVSLTENDTSNLPGVELVSFAMITNDNVSCIGLVQKSCRAGEVCEIMVNGLLEIENYFPEGTALFIDNGILSATEPTTGSIQNIAIVLKTGVEGRLLVNGEQPQQSQNIRFIAEKFVSTDVHAALLELESNIGSVATALQTTMETTEKLLIFDNVILLPFPSLGSVMYNAAWIFDGPQDTVYVENTCAVDPTNASLVLFDPLDNLNGLYAVVSYLRNVN